MWSCRRRTIRRSNSSSVLRPHPRRSTGPGDARSPRPPDHAAARTHPQPLNDHPPPTALNDSQLLVKAGPLVAGTTPHFGRWAAVTTRRHGAGRVTCVGTVPGRTLARALAAWLAPTARHGWVTSRHP